MIPDFCYKIKFIMFLYNNMAGCEVSLLLFITFQGVQEVQGVQGVQDDSIYR